MTAIHTDRTVEFKVFHFYGALGAGALGFQRGHARIGRVSGRFRTLGSVDVDPAACRDFKRLTGVDATCIDLFTRAMYKAFHGKEPPPGWVEATAQDIRDAAGGEFPDVAFFSAPCKGFSALLNAMSAASLKYQALNQLVIRALELMLEAWGDNPPALIIFENVPRIMTRGRELLDDVHDLLELHGYAVAETTHDCGELGGLAQHRHRFLMVARHRAKIRPFLYEPPTQRVRAVGEVLDELPLPGTALGPMHRLPRLHWKTWVRLALIEAGSDWRSLAKLNVVDGHLADIGIVPTGAPWQADVLGVRPWDQPSGVVAGRSSPTNGRYSVADPRPTRDLGDYQPYGVNRWGDSIGVVTGKAAPGTGAYTIADPRYGGGGLGEHYGKMRVEDWKDPAHTVTGSDRVGSGAMSVADPRPASSWAGKGRYGVTGFEEPAGAVIGASTTGTGACAVADPRLHVDGKFNNCFRVVRYDEAACAVTGGAGPSAGGQAVADPRLAWSKTDGGSFGGAGARHYGVLRYTDTSPAVTGSACHDNGAHSVADPRALPDAKWQGVPLIVSLDGTWHRPFSTLELAALQGFPVLDDFVLDGESDSAWRERIGNAVPPPAAEAIANTMLETLLRAEAGQSFALSASPIWVDRRLALALSVGLP